MAVNPRITNGCEFNCLDHPWRRHKCRIKGSLHQDLIIFFTRHKTPPATHPGTLYQDLTILSIVTKPLLLMATTSSTGLDNWPGVDDTPAGIYLIPLLPENTFQRRSNPDYRDKYMPPRKSDGRYRVLPWLTRFEKNEPLDLVGFRSDLDEWYPIP